MNKVKINVRRVLKDDEDVRPIAMTGYCCGVIPDNGFMIYLTNGYGIPLFVRDEDLEAALKKRHEKGRSIPIEAKSWNLDEEE